MLLLKMINNRINMHVMLQLHILTHIHLKAIEPKSELHASEFSTGAGKYNSLVSLLVNSGISFFPFIRDTPEASKP